MLLSCAEPQEDANVVRGNLRPISLRSVHPNLPSNGVVDTYGSIMLQIDEVRKDALTFLTCGYHCQDSFCYFLVRL